MGGGACALFRASIPSRSLRQKLATPPPPPRAGRVRPAASKPNRTPLLAPLGHHYIDSLARPWISLRLFTPKAMIFFLLLLTKPPPKLSAGPGGGVVNLCFRGTTDVALLWTCAYLRSRGLRLYYLGRALVPLVPGIGKKSPLPLPLPTPSHRFPRLRRATRACCCLPSFSSYGSGPGYGQGLHSGPHE